MWGCLRLSTISIWAKIVLNNLNKRIHVLRFVSELSKIDLSPVLISNDVDYCLDEFSCLFRSVIDFVALVCDIRVK